MSPCAIDAPRASREPILAGPRTRPATGCQCRNQRADDWWARKPDGAGDRDMRMDLEPEEGHAVLYRYRAPIVQMSHAWVVVQFPGSEGKTRARGWVAAGLGLQSVLRPLRRRLVHRRSPRS
jgi:hypothetical protein